MVMNGVAARINRMKMSSEMCAELLNVQIMERYLCNIQMTASYYNKIILRFDFFKNELWRFMVSEFLNFFMAFFSTKALVTI